MASSSNIPEVKYDVFLSFRGEDTRNNFTSHLNEALCRKKIQTFIDYKLDRGEEISPSLLEAIEQSRISVVILSEKYASSRWCLEELAKILDCKKRFGQMVIPIFYHVDPSHVRNQTGAFGKAFNERFGERLDVLQRFIFGLYSWFYPKKENDELQRWKIPLMEVSNLSGYTTDSKKRESELIGEIVTDILKRLEKMSPSDHSDLIGVESTIEEIESLLKIGSNDVCIVGIWGLGGIGKTSISRAIFNKYSSNFEGSFFTENVREESNNCRKLTVLREQLLWKILEDRYANIGLTLTKERLAHKKVFIVFDDVTSLDQIENLIGDLKCLGLGSRIIITSRDKQVLNNFCGADKIYELKGLHHLEALQLFSRHAFKHNGDTIKEYMELSEWMVTYAKGVPLALKVLGSFLLGKTKREWESAVDKLKRCPHQYIQSLLKISYDGLDYEEKEIFLDIACFFKGENRDIVIGVIDSCGYSAEIGLSVLIDKSLVIVSYDDKITMHDLLEEMGREIVRQESNGDPSKRSRLFDHKDISEVLTKNKEAETIKSVCLDVSRVGEIHLTPDAFSKMQNLKYLKVYSSHDGEDFNKLYGFQDVEFVLPELMFLFWHRYPWTSLSPKFHPENLIALEMPESNIEQLWPGVQDIVNLKHIDLSKSKHLLKCPDLSLAKNLETLNLYSCTSLIEIHSSIQYLNKLSKLNLNDCKSLCNIPSAICSKSLRYVGFIGCSNLTMVPSISCNVEELQLAGSAIRELPSSIENLSNLVTLNLDGCTRLESLPNSICKLKSLENLFLSGCLKLNGLPDEIGNLEALNKLHVGDTGIREVPPSIVCLNDLYELEFQGCKVQEHVGLISGLQCLMFLNLSNCGITELPSSLGQLTSLTHLYIGRNKFESIPASIINLSCLFNLDLCYCDELKSLPELPLNIRLMEACNCKSLELLSSTNFNNWHLLEVNFINCLKLDQSPIEDMVKIILQNVRRNQAGFMCNTCVPGSSIPEWFTFRSKGSSIELPPGCSNDDLVGFSACVVISIPDDRDNSKNLTLCCEYCKSDGPLPVTAQYEQKLETFRYGTRPLPDSDHLVFGYFHTDSASADFNSGVLYEFYIDDWEGEDYEVKACGILLDPPLVGPPHAKRQKLA